MNTDARPRQTRRSGLAWKASKLLQPHDTSTPKGRADERHRRVAMTAAASAFAKVISVSAALISVPLTLHYLGPERYGLWIMISSLAAILSFADLGVGNGIINSIATAYGRNDRHAIRTFISSGFFVLTLVALGILVIFALAHPFIPWQIVFNIKSSLAQEEAGTAVAVFVACFALAMPLGIVGRVQMALQKGFLASLWQCSASTLGLLGVIVTIYYQASLPWLVFSFMGAPLVVSCLNALLFFWRSQPDIAPSRDAINRAAAVQLLRTGGLFLVLQIVVAVAFASDSLVIAQVLGAQAVAEYAVPERMFSLITMVLAMVLSPLWPAYAEAITRGDAEWVKRTLRYSIFTSMGLAAFCSMILVLLGGHIMQAWVGEAVQPDLLLILGLALWKTIEAGANALAMFLNGAHVVRSQVIMGTLTACAALALKFILVPIVGVAGTVLATVSTYLLLTALPMAFMLPHIFRQLEARNVTRHL